MNVSRRNCSQQLRMSSMLRRRCLSLQLKHFPSLTNPIPNFSFSTITTASPNHDDVEHQQSGRPGPPPIRVGFTRSAGRGVFSTRRIGLGELIHTAQPAVSHPSLAIISSVCYLCLRRLIPGNNVAQPFCSNECREQSKAFYELEKKADWSSYHEYCRNQSLKYPLLMKRLACMVISGAASADCIDILQPARMLPAVDEEYSLLRKTFEGINVTNESLKFLTMQWYADVLARIRINAFRIEMVAGSYEDIMSLASASVESEAGVGNAVYILPSFYNHDCDPNVHIIWIDNCKAKLKAARDIEEGEELCICYIDASMDHEARQNVLANGFGFKCSCHRCLSGD